MISEKYEKQIIIKMRRMEKIKTTNRADTLRHRDSVADPGETPKFFQKNAFH